MCLSIVYPVGVVLRLMYFSACLGLMKDIIKLWICGCCVAGLGLAGDSLFVWLLILSSVVLQQLSQILQLVVLLLYVFIAFLEGSFADVLLPYKPFSTLSFAIRF